MLTRLTLTYSYFIPTCWPCSPSLPTLQPPVVCKSRTASLLGAPATGTLSSFPAWFQVSVTYFSLQSVGEDLIFLGLTSSRDGLVELLGYLFKLFQVYHSIFWRKRRIPAVKQCHRLILPLMSSPSECRHVNRWVAWKGHVYFHRVPQEDADLQDVPVAFPFTVISLLKVYLFLSMSNFFH